MQSLYRDTREHGAGPGQWPCRSDERQRSQWPLWRALPLPPPTALRCSPGFSLAMVKLPTNLPKMPFFLMKDHCWVSFSVVEGAGWDGGYERNPSCPWIKGDCLGLVLSERGWGHCPRYLPLLSKPTHVWAHTQQPPAAPTRPGNSHCIFHLTGPSLTIYPVAELLCISSK